MMIKIQTLFFALSLTLVGQLAFADEYDDARKVFTNAGESGAFFGKAYGYALFPTIGKGGVGIGGAYGNGRVYAGASTSVIPA